MSKKVKGQFGARIKAIDLDLHALLTDGIQTVIHGQAESFEIEPRYKSENPAINVCPEAVCHFMKKLGWEKGELETNGWQYDWWLKFTKGGQSFTASGSGYYGGFSFHKTDEP